MRKSTMVRPMHAATANVLSLVGQLSSSAGAERDSRPGIIAPSCSSGVAPKTNKTWPKNEFPPPNVRHHAHIQPQQMRSIFVPASCTVHHIRGYAQPSSQHHQPLAAVRLPQKKHRPAVLQVFQGLAPMARHRPREDFSTSACNALSSSQSALALLATQRLLCTCSSKGGSGG